MNNKLQEIIEKTKEDLEERKKRPVNVIPNLFRNLGSRGFKEMLNQVQHDNGLAFIAEIKFASPSEGDLGSTDLFLERAKEYEKAGADAISVVVEKHFFKGDISFISKIKKAVSLPVLMKDFVIDKYQIHEAKNAGADAILLIARIVDEKKLLTFVQMCKDLDIEPVVEIDNEKDIQKAINSKTEIIAVNARDLDTFKIDVSRACDILKKIPDEFIKLGFSGINTNIEVQKYKEAGLQGVLVGTSLMKAGNVKEFISSLRT